MYYNLKLEKNDLVKIYREPKSDISDLESMGILLERSEDFSCSFFMSYEKMYKDYTDMSSVNMEPDKQQLILNNTYDYLNHYLDKPSNKNVEEFKNLISKKCNRRKDNFNKIYRLVEEQKEKFKDDPTHLINNVFKVDTRYIVRYFRQKYIKNWTPTLFELQKWKVKLVMPDDPFFIPFTAYRYVAVIKESCPTDKTVTEVTNSSDYVKHSKYC